MAAGVGVQRVAAQRESFIRESLSCQEAECQSGQEGFRMLFLWGNCEKAITRPGRGSGHEPGDRAPVESSSIPCRPTVQLGSLPPAVSASVCCLENIYYGAPCDEEKLKRMMSIGAEHAWKMCSGMTLKTGMCGHLRNLR